MVDEKEYKERDEAEPPSSDDAEPSSSHVRCGTPFMSKFKGQTPKPFTGERRPFFLPLDNKDKE